MAHMKNAVMKAFDEETREVHHHLRDSDDCHYFIEYTARKPFDFSDENSFINNLKKSPSKRNSPWEWRWKVKAINDAAEALARELPEEWLSNSTFVPVPPSKARDDPEYDDRMSQILAKVGNGVDVRELVYQKQSMEATHVSDDRHSIEELVQNYDIDEDFVHPAPTHIVVVDDMMTAGAHFRAMVQVLEEQFPGVPLAGVFLARRIFPDEHE
jgi:hypothetical protein